MNKEKIIILDFGGQYTQLIAKSVRNTSVFSEIRNHEISLEEIIQENPNGIILSGGPDSIYTEDAPTIDKGILDLNIPVLGICYGMQLISHLQNGNVIHDENAIGEFGETETRVDTTSPLFQGINEKLITWMSHNDSVAENVLGKGFVEIARTANHIAAIANQQKNIYGVQFHPEVTHTENGLDIISNFTHRICGCGYDWTPSSFIDESINYIRDTVGHRKVINFVSGGVDSSYTAAILAKALPGEQVCNVYIEGLMRKNETEEVVRNLKNAGIEINVVYAEKRFIDAIKGISDPETKRKTIGNLFGKIMQEECEKLGLYPANTFLAQGTLYTDLIESGKGVGKKAHNIKSHHNVGCPFIEELKTRGMVIEPNRLIFKDEVRKAAEEIGLPPAIYQRQPFPGPGLGIRIVDGIEVNGANENHIRSGFYLAHESISSIAEEYNFSGYALPIKTVGVQGDERTYRYLGLIEGPRDWETIKRLANQIPKQCKGINRIIYELNPESKNGKYLSSILNTTVTEETMRLLQDIDSDVREITAKYSLTEKIAQEIVVLHGADIYNNNKRGIALRFVQTDDFMTVTPVRIGQESGLTWNALDEIYSKIIHKYGDKIGSVGYDITDKPPATTCWE